MKQIREAERTGVHVSPSAHVVLMKHSARPRVAGKSFVIGDEKLFIRGVTYGTFRPDEAGNEYQQAVVERDFAAMAANGINAVRTYTVPPRWLLDAAQRYHLYVMVGLPWEQHIAFLDDRSRVRSVEERVRSGVAACAGHPAVLCYAVGNEIPAPVVRWHGRRRIERFLSRLCGIVKSVDPDALVTYVNYPSTEYLRLSFVDFVAFNVYLESPPKLEAYLARLQNLAGDRPLLIAEIGLDSQAHGEQAQAQALAWQIRSVFAAGCAGAFVFSWTDEWNRGGHEVTEWSFGLTRRNRRTKPALQAVREAYAAVPFRDLTEWPRVSVVVCSCNGSATIRDCLEGLSRMAYPNYEVIVVDDGSTDATAEIANEFDVRLIRVENGGLSRARNIGLAMAEGDVVAYTDDDARPDPHWLSYLVSTLISTDHAGVGGPNIGCPDDGRVAECVGNAPGGPIHILLSDREAEHIPGCNMAFRKERLQAIDGFDPQFRVAGDDVDICWRLQERGWTIGFHPAAVVWHHRRHSILAYLKQQVGYGRAEALLERKWPHKYNEAGHHSWAGRLYGSGLTRALGWRRERIHYGTWGLAPFQTAQDTRPGTLGSLSLMPEWHLLTTALFCLSILGLHWAPLHLAVPFLTLIVMISVVQAIDSARHVPYQRSYRSRWLRLALHGLTALLHLFQPLARLLGRRGHHLNPRRCVPRGFPVRRPRSYIIWSERWRPRDSWLQLVESILRDHGVTVRRGGSFDRWDLEVRGGLLGGARLSMVNEEHGRGQQLLRFRCWPRWSVWILLPLGITLPLSIAAALDHDWLDLAVLGILAFMALERAFRSAMMALATLVSALRRAETTMPSLHRVEGGKPSRSPITASQLQGERASNE